MSKITDKEKQIVEKGVKTLPLMNVYERGYMIGLMTAYANKYSSSQETNERK